MFSLLFPSLAFVIFSGIWFVKTVKRALTGSISKVPGPVLNRWTNLPLKIRSLRGRKIYYVDALHRQYGPLVRIAPTEVASCSPASNHQIHKIGSGHLKAAWYPEFSPEPDGQVGIFAQRDPKLHAIRRKLFSRAFSQNALADWEDLLRKQTKLAVSKMKDEAARNGGVTDILKWWTFMSTDIFTELGFGESSGSLEKGEKSEYIHDLECALALCAFNYELPFLTTILTYLPIPSIQYFLNSDSRMRAHGRESIRRSKSLFSTDPSKRRKTLFSKMIETSESGEERLNDELLSREAKNLTIAGSDTTAITLTYLIWAVLRHPEVKEKLLVETNVGELRYLGLVIQETLRLYGAAPGGLPRVVPGEGGWYDGVWLEGGTNVTTQAFTLHRNPDVYENPEAFIPERWINATQIMKDSFMAFGAGSRVCIGSHLARLNLSLGAVNFFREFPNAVIAPSTTDSDMEFENYFLVTPRSHKCDIQVA